MKQREEVFTENPLNLVFPEYGKVIDLSHFKRDCFEKDLKAAGILKIRFHDLRHTFASHFMMKGGNLYDL
jgi:integrase